ncbi:MAG: methyltransferase domain-containing protein [Candidatus Omnitrophota bacterium]
MEGYPYKKARNEPADKQIWNDDYVHSSEKLPMDLALGRYKADEFIYLVACWIGNLEGKRILKTDLREEAFGEDQILFSLPVTDSQICALDICTATVQKARMRQVDKGFRHDYINADVRKLPFRDNAFDLILSTSTLDHFTNEGDFKKSLLELKRVIKPTGCMILTLNNKCNPSFFVMLKLERILGLKPFPVQFFNLAQLRKICKEINLSIKDASYIVHILSPINNVLLLLRKFLSTKVVDKLAERYVSFAQWLGSKQRIKFLTGWFIAIKCVK